METNILDEKVEKLDTHFHALFTNTDYERMLTRAVKLNEEVGELCEAVLFVGNEQRKEKTDIDFGGEVADVIISTLMLARTQGVDVWSEVEKKLDRILAKHNIA